MRKVNFTSMTRTASGGKATRVRRLGTVSSVLAPDTHCGTTQWLWYWKDSAGQWTQYGDVDVSFKLLNNACIVMARCSIRISITRGAVSAARVISVDNHEMSCFTISYAKVSPVL